MDTFIILYTDHPFGVHLFALKMRKDDYFSHSILRPEWAY
jgi:hypothetical protein